MKTYRWLSTRSRLYADDDAKTGQRHGFLVQSLPMIEFRSCITDEKQNSILSLQENGLYIITSQTAVHFLLESQQHEQFRNVLRSRKVLAIGKKTAKSLQNNGIIPSIVGEYGIEQLLQSHSCFDWPKYHAVFLVTANYKENLLDLANHAQFLSVNVIPVYNSYCPGYDNIITCINSLSPDVVSFGSGETIKNFLSYFSSSNEASEFLKSKTVAVLGKSAFETAQKNHIVVNILSDTPSFDDLMKKAYQYLLEYSG